MRVATKIRELLDNCTLEISMNEKLNVQIFVFDKRDNTVGMFENGTYSQTMNMAYRYLKKKDRYGQCKKVVAKQVI